MKHKLFFLIFTCLWLGVLFIGCTPTIRTVEVTRIVPQTVVVTQVIPQMVQVNITNTPEPTKTVDLSPTRTPTPKWTPAFTETPVTIWLLTPGMDILSKTNRPNIEKFVSETYIKTYLVMTYGESSFTDGKIFCGYVPLGIENDGRALKAYLNILCEEYYQSDQEIKKGTGLGLPVVLHIEVRDGQYRIIKSSRSTNDYGHYLNSNFPGSIRSLIDAPFNPGGEPNTLTAASQEMSRVMKQEVKAYFGK